MDLQNFFDEHGNFRCSFENIGSLKGVPKKIDGNFRCPYTNITSLEGAPKYVGGHFDCHATKITSLKGAPEKVGGYFSCSNTRITSLEGAPKKCRQLICFNTKITKEQIINCLRHSDCKTVYSDFGFFYKKDVIKKLSVE